MKATSEHSTGSRRTMLSIRTKIERGGERLWRFADFQDLPPAALAQAFSRLARRGDLQRLSKGIYYRPRETAFGPSRPNPIALHRLATQGRAIFPSGISAASLLGFTTQTAKRGELSTTAQSLPRKLIGMDTAVHTRRPASWSKLSETEGALLDFLRHGGRFTELSPEATIQKLLTHLRQERRFEHLASIAESEPPRVRAMLGALGEQLGGEPRTLQALQRSLNPLSRFDFGILAALPNARDWQAKITN